MGLELNTTQWLLVANGIGVWTFTIAYLYTLATTKKKATNGSDVSGLLERLKNEPALIGGVLTTGAALLAAFGLELSASQVGAISAFIAATLAILVRQVVTPVRKLDN